MGYAAVLFDFYGTLAHADFRPRPIEDVARDHGYEVPRDILDRWSWHPEDDLEHREQSVSREAYAGFLRQRRRDQLIASGVGPDDVEALLDDIDGQGELFTLQPYPETLEVLAALRERGVRIAICSNWDWDLDRAIASAGLTGEAEVEITSAQVGCRKPHPQIYEVTLDALGIDAGDALFVGDTFDCDVEGPIAAGMTAVHIHRGDHDDATPPLPPERAHRVTDLRGVLNLL
jgi:putative hydrolase of the HAD superfamily